ncbi:diacylglycerol kinase family protein [Fictibacillus terranigra]|uniref:Diacylglycerol kinase family protein n=1 Tax=Fictibacillus terranigra TaxID=3058424 RepID=A0ABT8EA59_9BACL|nr:diacylglycerol kinase family protein [Fictibacillus sp. CENA-BCM004]MDN4074801.1 diacylglycerol kinase family protein [Fictibacillus sp. CENA-BCM004]
MGPSARRFVRSFGYAWEGIKAAVSGEQNIKIHLGVGCFVLLAAYALHFSAERFAILLLVIGAVICLEIMNTALERVVDLVTDDFHPLAKQAKDMAAGAVLVFSVIAVIIGLLLFFKPALHYFS